MQLHSRKQRKVRHTGSAAQWAGGRRLPDDIGFAVEVGPGGRHAETSPYDSIPVSRSRQAQPRVLCYSEHVRLSAVWFFEGSGLPPRPEKTLVRHPLLPNG